MAELQEKVAHDFGERFGERPSLLVRAPGRVNLIGEHTDYNDGFVLPLAIDRAVWIALRRRNDREVHLSSVDYGETAVFHLDNFQHDGPGWIEYVKGVAWSLQAAGYALPGWEGVFAGNVPRGAGLSSSAAVELAVARAFMAVAHEPWQPARMARLCQRAENEWVGVNCGIMDQMIAAAGEAGHALLIDCRSLATDSVPLPPATAVVILDTNTRRDLVDSAYNKRRARCEAAAAYFGVPALRDVSLRQFQSQADNLDPVTRRRARHVISENARVLACVRAMNAGSAEQIGRLMNASHASLRDDFAVSSNELDTVVAIAQAAPGCYGARMTGAGFGGCAVALVARAQVQLFVTAVATAYEEETRLTPNLYLCQPSQGAMLVA